MTVFAYKCRTCGARFDSTSRSLTSCPECLSRDLGRDYTTVNLTVTSFVPHFNHAVGAPVSTSRQFDELLKIRGEEAGSAFTRIEPGDMPRPIADDGIFDTQMKTIRDRGLNPKDLV